MYLQHMKRYNGILKRRSYNSFTAHPTKEQNHTKLFIEVMHNHGWYDVQASHINQSAKDQINKQIAYQLENRINELEQNNQQFQ